MGLPVQILESDALREVLTPRPSYTAEEREVFYNAMIHIGTLLASHEVNVIFDATAHRRRWREQAREAFPRFLEVLVDTPPALCARRDPKGIYRKAERGEAETVPGKQLAFEAPDSPEVRVDGAAPPERSVNAVLAAMRSHGFDLPFMA
jgi:adenylylsulfate kinase